VEEPTTVDGPRSLRPGSRFGRYRLARLLGEGGFGQVWEAEDTVMDRVVALKLLRSEYSGNEKFRQRLFREARAAGRLHEPHVVPIQCQPAARRHSPGNRLSPRNLGEFAVALRSRKGCRPCSPSTAAVNASTFCP
jgi:hypothetical protein